MHSFPCRARIVPRSSSVFEDEPMVRNEASIIAAQMRSLVGSLLKNQQHNRLQGVGYRPVGQGRPRTSDLEAIGRVFVSLAAQRATIRCGVLGRRRGKVIPRLSGLSQTRSFRNGEPGRGLVDRSRGCSRNHSRGLRPAQRKRLNSLTTLWRGCGLGVGPRPHHSPAVDDLWFRLVTSNTEIQMATEFRVPRRCRYPTMLLGDQRNADFRPRVPDTPCLHK